MQRPGNALFDALCSYSRANYAHKWSFCGRSTLSWLDYPGPLLKSITRSVTRIIYSTFDDFIPPDLLATSPEPSHSAPHLCSGGRCTSSTILSTSARDEQHAVPGLWELTQPRVHACPLQSRSFPPAGPLQSRSRKRAPSGLLVQPLGPAPGPSRASLRVFRVRRPGGFKGSPLLATRRYYACGPRLPAFPFARRTCRVAGSRDSTARIGNVMVAGLGRRPGAAGVIRIGAARGAWRE